MTVIELKDSAQLQIKNQVASAFTNKTLVKGFHQTIKALSQYHANPVLKLIIGGTLDEHHSQVLNSFLEKTKLQIPVYKISDKTLVSNIIRSIEEQDGKKPRSPFSCKLFCIKTRAN